MKKTEKILIIALCVGFLSIILGCAEPNPFLGTWADNVGNTITFGAEKEFTASIKNNVGTPIQYDGNYTVILNSITMETKSGIVTISEWDMRGSILHLFWTDYDKVTQQLSLYKVK